MTIEGIWTGELYGAFGWENRGVYVFENGRVIGGDNRQYTTGSYHHSGDRVTGEMTIYYYGPPRTVFGEKSEQFTIDMDATVKDGVIEGTVNRRDRDSFPLQYRLTKRMDLPAT